MYHIHWKNRENLRCEQCYLSHFLFYDLQYFLNSVTLYTRHIKNGKTRLSLSQQSRCQPAALPRQVLWRWGWAGGCCRLLAGAFTLTTTLLSCFFSLSFLTKSPSSFIISMLQNIKALRKCRFAYLGHVTYCTYSSLNTDHKVQTPR